jgi:nitrate reductase / nitrite oxidoreductase, alpha subunit
MNSTSAWYAHTDQWRYETVTAKEILSPTAPEGDWESLSLIDYNIRAERMGWLPSAPQLRTNPLDVGKAAKAAGKEVPPMSPRAEIGRLEMSCEDPDAPENWPRNLFVWRSNLLGSSGKGHEYFLKHLLGTDHGVQGKDLGEEGRQKPSRRAGTTRRPRASSTCWSASTSACPPPPSIPTSCCPRPAGTRRTTSTPRTCTPSSTRCRRRWTRPMSRRPTGTSSRRSPKKFSEVAPEILGVETDVVQLPLQHDSPDGIAQPVVKDWKRGECDLIPGKTAPAYIAVERDYPNLYARFTALGPLMEKVGNGGKGIAWDTKTEVHHLKALNGRDRRGPTKGMADRKRHRRLRGGADAGAGNQWRGRGQGLGRAGKGHRARPRPSGRGQAGREDPLPRHRRPAAQDHLVAHLVGHRERGGLLQCRLDQRARADPLAHALGAPAALPGSRVDARLRRVLRHLAPAGRPEDHHPDATKALQAARSMWC